MRGNKKRRERKKPSKKKKQLPRDCVLRTQPREKQKKKKKEIQESTLSKVSPSHPVSNILSRMGSWGWEKLSPPLFKYLDGASNCYATGTLPVYETSSTHQNESYETPPPPTTCFSRETFETGVSWHAVFHRNRPYPRTDRYK